MANFFLRDIDAETFRQARAQCMGRGLRLVDVINDLLRTWLKGLPKQAGPATVKSRKD